MDLATGGRYIHNNRLNTKAEHEGPKMWDCVTPGWGETVQATPTIT